MTELLVASGIGALTAAGVYLVLRKRTFDAILGLTLLSYAINLFLFASGRLRRNQAPILQDGVATTLAHYTDPLPQALVLTAIVISFGMTALLLVLAIRSYASQGTDRIDGRQDSP